MIYHATNFENLQSILVNGIKPADWSGETYFANNPSYAAGFLQMRGVQQIVVFAVNTVDLDPNLLEEGSDHAAAFFPAAGQKGSRDARGLGAAHSGPNQRLNPLILRPAGGLGTGSDCRASGRLRGAA